MRRYCEHCLQPYDPENLANRIMWLIRQDLDVIYYQAVLTVQLMSKPRLVLQALRSLEARGFVERATAPYIPDGSFGWRATPRESIAALTPEQIAKWGNSVVTWRDKMTVEEIRDKLVEQGCPEDLAGDLATDLKDK